METIQRFFQNIYLSATKPQSYPPRLTQTFSSGLGYLYWLLVCVTLISAVGFAIILWSARPAIQTFVDHAQEELAVFYPDELVLTLSGAELSTNVETPYTLDPAFWTSDAFQKEMNDEEHNVPAHFVVIDPDATVDSYPSYDTAVLLTRTAAVMKDDKNGVRVQFYSDLELTEPITITKEKYMELVIAVQPFVEKVPAIVDGFMITLLILWPFVGAFFYGIGLLIYLLIFTLVVMLLAMPMKRRLRYGQLYQLGLYGITLSVLYSLISSWIPPLAAVPFVFTVIFLVWMGMVIKTFPVAPKPAAKKITAAKAGSASPWNEHTA